MKDLSEVTENAKEIPHLLQGHALLSSVRTLPQVSLQTKRVPNIKPAVLLMERAALI